MTSRSRANHHDARKWSWSPTAGSSGWSSRTKTSLAVSHATPRPLGEADPVSCWTPSNSGVVGPTDVVHGSVSGPRRRARFPRFSTAAPLVRFNNRDLTPCPGTAPPSHPHQQVDPTSLGRLPTTADEPPLIDNLQRSDLDEPWPLHKTRDSS